MAGLFLRLEIDTLGINAMVVDQRNSHALIKEECRVMFTDLVDSDDQPDPFDAAMERVSSQLDLGSCSSSIVFVSPLFVSFRTIDLPFRSKKKVQQVLPFELETLLPDINETYSSDFHRLDIAKESNLILSASLAESRVETYVSKLCSLGVKPRVITPLGYANAAGFLKQRKEVSTVVFLDITDAEITLVLVKDRTPCVVRSFPAARTRPEDLVAPVKQTIIGFQQRTGIDLSFDIIVHAVQTRLTADRVCTTLEKELAGVSGFGSVTTGVQQTLTPETIRPNAFSLDLSPESRETGLFNFCRGKYGESSFLKTYSRNIAVSAVLLLVAAAVLILNISLENSALEKQIASIDDDALAIFTTTFPDQKNVQDPYLQMTATVQAALKKSSSEKETNRGINRTDITVLSALNELSRKINASTDMDVSRLLFNTDPGRIVLSGSTGNFNNVDKIKSRIESSVLFETVTISSAAADKKGARVNFKFNIEL